jgi:hypothetical protein
MELMGVAYINGALKRPADLPDKRLAVQLHDKIAFGSKNGVSIEFCMCRRIV